MARADDVIRIHLSTKPNLARLRKDNPKKYAEIMATMVSLAEEAASPDRPIPWYDLPSMFDENLNFAEVATAVFRAFFSSEYISPDNFSILGADVHPMSLLRKKQFGPNSTYSVWKKHFGMPEEAEVNGETITAALRKLLYYARYIDVDKFGKALMSNQLEAHKALPLTQAEKLVFYPALRYQQKTFGEMMVGKFWDEIGAFYGGELSRAEGKRPCPACNRGILEEIGDYEVCPACNIGFKMV